jgi:hypothetical protein
VKVHAFGKRLALDFLPNRNQRITKKKILSKKEKKSKQDDPNRGRQKKIEWLYQAHDGMDKRERWSIITQFINYSYTAVHVYTSQKTRIQVGLASPRSGANTSHACPNVIFNPEFIQIFLRFGFVVRGR